MAKLALGLATIALVLSGVAMFKTPDGATSDPLGGTSVYQKTSFMEGLFVGRNRHIDIQNDGDITIGSTATTTLDFNFACFQFNPTSTATNVKIRATTTASGIALGSAFYSSYGTCQ